MKKPRLPAEWEAQSGVMLTWPHEGTDWASLLEHTYPVFARIGSVISQYQVVLNVCVDSSHKAHVSDLLAHQSANPDNLRFALSPSNDTWARDHAPITTLSGGEPELHDFGFDGWGKKFPAELDNRINRQLDTQKVFGSARMHTHSLVLEGGAIETDGQGSLLATRSSVLDKTRNPTCSDEEIEGLLRDILGIKRFLWLDYGELSGDDTDAHIDILARFTDLHTIVYSSAPEGDSDHEALQAMYRQLRSFRTQQGEPYRLKALPFPGIMRDEEGRRLPAGYANFLITNHQVLLPVYGVEADRQAIALIQECFPERRIEPIDCRTIIRQNGSLHCLTMQFPAAAAI